MKWKRGRDFGWLVDGPGRYWVLRTRRWPFAPWDAMTYSDDGGFERIAGGFFSRFSAERWIEKALQEERAIPGFPGYVVNALGSFGPAGNHGLKR